jgi:lauroyl/myristoyl acyltransferase
VCPAHSPSPSGGPHATGGRGAAEKVRWHLHGLNTATIFGLTRWGVGRLPRRLSYGIGHVGTWLAFHLMRQATAALIGNLRVVAPDLGERDLRRLALRTYRSYARETIDFICGLSMSRQELVSCLSRASAFTQARPDGNGMLLLTGHIGNLDLGAMILRVIFDWPLTAVVLPDDDPAVAEHRRQMRDSLGIESIVVRGSVDTALRVRRRLAENGVVVLVSDRALGRDRVDVEFFGRRTAFLRSPALMGYLSGAPLVPSFILRQPDGRYAGFSLDPIRVERTGDRDANVQAAMQAFASGLEHIVREYPHLWYHFYPYWGEGHEPSEPSGADGRVAPEAPEDGPR